MSESTSPPTPPALQFDRAVGTGEASSPGVACTQCKRAITDSYFNLSRSPFCDSCKTAIEREYAQSLTPRAFGKAALFGLGAAIGGAIVYYAVIAITEFEIGIVAILIGYMVGYSIRKATRGWGARRYQVLGAALTYFAVALAYVPLAIKGTSDSPKVSADSTRAATHDSAAVKPFVAESVLSSTSVAAAKRDTLDAKPVGLLKSFGVLLLFALALPVMMVFGTMPSGLISALIIGIGIRQAWKMTAAPALTFAGPLKVAPPGDPATRSPSA